MQYIGKRVGSLIAKAPKPLPLSNRSAVFAERRSAFVCALKALGLHKFEEDFPVIIHVAGTKGKGSTCAMVESICLHAGLKTALFTSPHLVRINERFRVCGKAVGDDVLKAHFDKVWATLEEHQVTLGYFFFLTLLAYDIFSKTAVDVLIIEVGLGGRYDSTNILSRKTACAVTQLDYDHMEFLGDTIDLIASEKAGIFMQDTPAFTVDSQEPAAMEVLRKEAQQKGVSLNVLAPLDKKEYVLGMAGEHQLYNAALAKALCEASLGTKISEEAVKEGLRTATLAGRNQVFERQGRVFYLDGAHTPKSMETCLAWFESLNVERPILVFTCLHTKAVVDMMKIILGSSVRFRTVIFAPGDSTKPSSSKQKMAHEYLGIEAGELQGPENTWTETLLKVWNHLSAENPGQSGAGKNGEAKVCESIASALKSIEEEEDKNAPVFITGSLLFVGDWLKVLGWTS